MYTPPPTSLVPVTPRHVCIALAPTRPHMALQVVSLAPLSALTALTDLWLQNNAVAAPPELRVLAGLSGLQRLAIGNNPVAKASEGLEGCWGLMVNHAGVLGWRGAVSERFRTSYSFVASCI